MSIQEQAVVFECGAEQLLGIVSTSAAATDLGVLIVVGGPQYRVGSHRQFVLLARYLAQHGVPTFRFDYRGMGDSDGPRRAFFDVDEDLRAAIDALCQAAPSVKRVVIWGLCDAASATMIYAPKDDRVVGLIVLNPWVREDQSQAVAQLKHYYGQRVLSGAFWKKMLRGEVNVLRSCAELLTTSRTATKRHARPDTSATFQDRMLQGWQQFRGPTLLVLSGNDLTAKEFVEYSGARPAWRACVDSSAVSRSDFPEADHTFSTAAWRDQVAAQSLKWIQQLR